MECAPTLRSACSVHRGTASSSIIRSFRRPTIRWLGRRTDSDWAPTSAADRSRCWPRASARQSKASCTSMPRGPVFGGRTAGQAAAAGRCGVHGSALARARGHLDHQRPFRPAVAHRGTALRRHARAGMVGRGVSRRRPRCLRFGRRVGRVRHRSPGALRRKPGRLRRLWPIRRDSRIQPHLSSVERAAARPPLRVRVVRRPLPAAVLYLQCYDESRPALRRDGAVDRAGWTGSVLAGLAAGSHASIRRTGGESQQRLGDPK